MVWVASVANAPKVIAALRDFGAPLMGLTEAELHHPGIGLQIGVEPGRIDVLTAVSGVRFEDAWPSSIQADFTDGVRCHVIGLSHLLQNKRAAARPPDLADVAALGAPAAAEAIAPLGGALVNRLRRGFTPLSQRARR